MQSPRIVLHIPHNSTEIPSDVRKKFALSDEELVAELLSMTDSFTAELFAAPFPAESVVYDTSRLVVDPERFEHDAQESMSQRGMGVIYTRTSTGRVLRESPDAKEREVLLDNYYRPHHRRLTDAVRRAVDAHGSCLIIDCHSFASLPLPYEPVQDRERPDFCIGTETGHTPPSLATTAQHFLESAGYSVAINTPFAGAIVPMDFYRSTDAVSSIMIEVNRGLYMDERTGEKSGQFERTATQVRQLLLKLSD